jgi:hypothetical protein
MGFQNMELILNECDFIVEIEGGAKVTLSKKTEYLHYGSSERADFFTNNRGIFTL